MKINDNGIRYKSGKRKGEIIDKYKSIITELKSHKNEKNFKLHLKKFTGSYRHLKLEDKEDNYIKVLKIYNIKFSFGNDAPKGGVQGDYIEIKVDKRNHFWK